MASHAHTPTHRGYPIAVTVDGLTYGFDTAEERDAFLAEYRDTHREQIAERWRNAEDMLEEFRAKLAARTGGEGIPIEEIDRAWREAKGG